MDNNDKLEALMNMAAELNAGLAADILDVPIIEHFKLQKTFHPNIIFAAVSDDDYIEQLVFDSVLPENVDVEEKIKQVVADTIEEMKNNDLKYPNDNLYFYKLHKFEGGNLRLRVYSSLSAKTSNCISFFVFILY